MYTSGPAVEYFYEGSENLVIAQACVVRNARQERQDCAKSAKAVKNIYYPLYLFLALVLALLASI
jgi:nitrogen fixation/metabolism regulation signal transduction histidine kinase